METLGIRLNNPLCIRYVQKNKWIGSCGQENGFVKFETLNSGVRAAVFLLLKYIFSYKLFTVRDIIERFAPVNDGNNVDLYVCTVVKYMAYVYEYDVENFMSKVIRRGEGFEERFATLVIAMALVECSISSYNYFIDNNFCKLVFDALDEYMINVLKPLYGTNDWDKIYEIVKNKVE